MAGDYLSENEKLFLLFTAHRAIENHLFGRPLDGLEELVKSFSLKEQLEFQLSPDSPVLQNGDAFVSIYIDGQLRGCIGTFAGKTPLWRTVQEMAISAATKDPRFNPLSTDELDRVKCEISVLTRPQPVSSIEEIQVGRDGLILEHGWFRGVLLPQVAVEYGWDREEFLAHTAMKAGLPPTAWRDPQTRLYRFQAVVFSDPELIKKK